MAFRIASDWSRKAIGLLVVLTLLGTGACSVAPPKGVEVVTPFEIERYLGTWYEIARLDHSFERNLSNVQAHYRLKPDGDLEVVNRGYNADTGRWKEVAGNAKFTGASDVGSLKVLFFGPFYGGYHLVALDQRDYRWAMVVGPSRDYLWILARDKQLSDEVREQLLAQALKLGIDVSQLIWVVQDRNGT
ncbi:lipocalin family protein [Pseudomonas sp. BBP2017]|uniref:lipocalin family protein n=1 Tax=Pseudomonas sp. BBP2017 TaxID=2109731 RepID=UPI000D1241E0|nr:lipocalin family protein [Pseudomonas sp. BBP2017]PSS58759.1 lipocalin [Pseudomonas sp. BBP2017]